MAKRYSIRPCEFCKEIFQPVTSNQKHCSMPCRFWANVNILGNDDCWEWQLHKTEDGYGRFWMDNFRWCEQSHRMAWELKNGLIPEFIWVLHHCDNPPCCNPSHLFLGTQIDNMADMVAKNRSPKNSIGEMNQKSKLTEKHVHAIRKAIISGATYNSLMDQYAISRSTVSDIKCGKTWKHI